MFKHMFKHNNQPTLNTEIVFFKEQEVVQITTFLDRKGKKLGNGTFGVVFEYQNMAYKIPLLQATKRFNEETGYTEPSNESLAQRSARIINELPCNRNAGFIAKTTGLNNDVLVTPIVQNVGQLNRDQLQQIDCSILEHRRVMYDPNPNNFGWYNGQIVVFDVDLILQPSMYRSPSPWSKAHIQSTDFDQFHIFREKILNKYGK